MTKLNAQAQQVLDYMLERGGISRREAMELGILNLPARVLDIRTAYGPESVVTEMWPPDGTGQYAVYRFRGLREEQAELFSCPEPSGNLRGFRASETARDNDTYGG
jgi:hypothetical protein